MLSRTIKKGLGKSLLKVVVLNQIVSVLIFLVPTIFVGCEIAKEVDRSNKIHVKNVDKEPVERVVITWGKREIVFDPADYKATEFTNILKPIMIRNDVDTIMKINVYYKGKSEPVIYEKELKLIMKEKKTVEVRLLKDKVLVKKKLELEFRH